MKFRIVEIAGIAVIAEIDGPHEQITAVPAISAIPAILITELFRPTRRTSD
ncbi:MAG TPA: hypothetical protein VES66_00125 [Terriglobales bacterium]|nr:hypothetical protein [Terriglobales bacterium]